MLILYYKWIHLMPKTKVIAIRISPWVFYRVRKIANDKGRSFNSLINIMLRELIKKEKGE